MQKISITKIQDFQNKINKHYQNKQGITNLLNKSIFKAVPFSTFAIKYLMKAHHEKLVKYNGKYVLYSVNTNRTKILNKPHMKQLYQDYDNWMNSTAFNRIYNLLFSKTPYISSYLIQKVTGISHSKISALRNHKQHIYNLSIQTAIKLDNFYKQRLLIPGVHYQPTPSDIASTYINKAHRQTVHKEYLAIENQQMLDASYARELLLVVSYKLKHSRIGDNCKNDFGVILDKSLSLYNSREYIKSINITTDIMHIIKQLNMSHTTSVAMQTGSYILYTLSRDNGLKLLATSQDDIHADGVAAMLIIIKTYLPKKNRNAKLKWLAQLLTCTNADTATRFFKENLLKVNDIFNKYLVSLHLLDFIHGQYQLSKQFKVIIAHPSVLENKIHKLGIKIKPQKLLNNIIYTLITSLYIPTKYQKYAGLSFGLTLFNLSSKKQLSNAFSRPGEKKHIMIPWGIYRNLILCSIDSIIITPKSRYLPSKAYDKLINQLDNLDIYMNEHRPK